MKRITPRGARAALSAAVAAAAGLSLAGCGARVVASFNTETAVVTFTVGGSVSGLSGSGLTLQNNGGDTLAIGANGAFTFPTTLITGNSYNVSVLTQPSAPNQTCAVTHGSGIVSGGNITGIQVVCADKDSPLDTIGGFASGVLGSGLVLQDNGGDELVVPSTGSFTFATALPAGMPYNVTVLSPPINPYQNCVVAAGSGTTGGDNVTNVSVSCQTNPNPAYTIGGTVTGISGASPLVLQDNGRDNLTLSADGPFQFSLPIPSGSSYNVTALSASGQQSQTCAFTDASGIVDNAPVTNVAIACKVNVVVQVSVSGLAGSGLVLQDNGGDNLAVTKNGTIAFATALASGASYDVTVLTQPTNPIQNCVVSHGVGTAAPPAVTGITVTCTTLGYTLGGTVAGLAGTGLVLQDNGGNNLAITQNGAFAFPLVLPSGTPYDVTVLTQPTSLSQTCSVQYGSGSIDSGNVNSIEVVCTTNTYTVGGTLSGLPVGAALTVVLQDDGGAGFSVSADGPFTFPTPLASGTAYLVTVESAPAGYYCAVGGAGGTVTNANITSVVVTCALIGAYAYVTNGTDGTISGYVIDANSGELLAFPAPIATGGTRPSSIVSGCLPTAVTGTLYVTNEGSNTLSQFTANLDTGALSVIAAPIGTGAAPAFADFAITSGACVAIALNSGGNSASAYLAGATGALSAVTGSPFGTGTDPVGSANLSFGGETPFTVEYIASNGSNTASAYTVDNTTGAFALVSGEGITNPIATGTAPVAVATTFATINATSFAFAYVVNQGSDNVSAYGVDEGTGAMTAIANSATGNGPTAISIVSNELAAPDTIYYAYVANGTDSTISSYTVNLSAAAGPFGELIPTGLSPVATGTNPVSITSAVVSSGTYLYVVNGASDSVSVFSINLTTGALTPVSGSPFATGTAPSSIALQYPPSD